MADGDRSMIAVLGALEGEISAFTRNMVNLEIEEWNGRRIYSGKISEEKCVVTWSGVGKIFASSAVQHVIDIYNPEIVFFVGIAGSLDSGLRKGDMVIARETVIYDFDISYFGLEKGEIPLPYAGNNGRRTIHNIKTDGNLLKKAVSLKTDGFRIKSVPVFTGDMFLTEENAPEEIRSVPEAVVDMEGGAAALVCMENGVQFLLARIISDTPGERKIKGFKGFLDRSSEKLYKLIESIVNF